MALSIYRIAQLISAGKAQIRSTIANVGTEDGSDLSTLVTVAGRMFQAGQVAAKYVYDQVLPSTADADNRERMLSLYGVNLEREATKARGYVLLAGKTGGSTPAGTKLTFPGTAFADGQARTFTTLEDCQYRSAGIYTLSIVSGNVWRAVVYNGSGAKNVHGVVAGEAIRISYGSDRYEFNAIKRVNSEDSSIDLMWPMLDDPVIGETIVNEWPVYTADDATGSLVPVECDTAGKVGNVGRALITTEENAESYIWARLVEVGGGGDAIVGTDTDEDRQVRLIEDWAAGAPSLGNMAHWREIALSCPDVDLDDAVVYQHARGPGTIDIVAIGRKQRIIPTSFPDARTEYVHGNGRKISAVQVAKLQAWCESRASYHDDVLVRQVEWEFRGEDPVLDIYGSQAFFKSVTNLNLQVTANEGYGPDCGDGVAVQTPYGGSPVSSTKLYPTTSGAVPSALQAGHRIWVRFRPSSSRVNSLYSPCMTVVTTILSVDKDAAFVTVADLSKALPPHDSVAYEGMGSAYAAPMVVDWGPAGPLTQPVLDAVYDYYDSLGPGSYLDAPKDPSYVRQFYTGSTAIAPYRGTAISRWPAEGRRWSSSFRGSELLARIMAIPGVKSVSSSFADMDALPFHTLAPRSVVARY